MFTVWGSLRPCEKEPNFSHAGLCFSVFPVRTCVSFLFAGGHDKIRLSLLRFAVQTKSPSKLILSGIQSAESRCSDLKAAQPKTVLLAV